MRMQIKIKISLYFYEITKYFFFFRSSKTEQNFSVIINLPPQRFQITCKYKSCHFYRFYQFQREFICNIYCIDFLQKKKKTNSPLKPTSQ